MVQMKMNKDEYNKIQILLPDICPQIGFSLKVEDDNLVVLGLCDSAPCIVEFDMTDSEYEETLDDLNELEIEAFDTPHGTYPSESSPAYQKYLKYGCLYDILSNSEIIEKQRSEITPLFSYIFSPHYVPPNKICRLVSMLSVEGHLHES